MTSSSATDVPELWFGYLKNHNVALCQIKLRGKHDTGPWLSRHFGALPQIDDCMH
jgi:hypothetical protein